MEYERTPRVLLIEDDEDVAKTLERSLRKEGCEVWIASDAEAGLERVVAFLPDLVVLDLAVAGLVKDVPSGFTRHDDDVPILVLSHDDADESEDRLTKPFEREEFIDRVRALLKVRPPRIPAALAVENLRLNPDTHEVTHGDRSMDLSPREFELLEYLMRNAGKTISRQALLDDVWSYDPGSITNTIEVFVSNLRRKLEANGEPRLLHTIRGEGYALGGENDAPG